MAAIKQQSGSFPFAVEAERRGVVKNSTKAKGLRVFTGTLCVDGVEARGFIAAKSLRKVALETDNSESYVRSHWSVTKNAEKIRVALQSPGQVFYCESRHAHRQDAEFLPLKSRMRRSIEDHLHSLIQVGLQKINEGDIERLAEAVERVLTFFKGYDAAYISRIDHLEFQAVVDQLLFQISHLSEVDTLRFLEHIGRPLTNDEMIRYFFRLG